MPDKPKPLAADVFRKIMKIAELTADPARLPELSVGAATVVNQFRVDVAKLGAEAAKQQLSLRRKLESVLASPRPTTINRIIIRKTLEVLGPEDG